MSRERRPTCMRVAPPSEEEVQAASEATSEQFGVFILTAAYSGLRLFEAANLIAADLSGNRLKVRRGKMGYEDEESVLFEPGLSAFGAYAEGREGWVFRTPRGGHYTRQHVHRLWTAAKRDAGLDPGIRFHDLRHAHACWLLDRGVSDEDVAAQLRHHDFGRQVKATYGRFRSVRAALERVEETWDSSR
jgi:integrase